MVRSEQDAANGTFRFILRPNSSLDARQTRWLLAAIGAVMASIGVGFAVLGLWPVLPFSGTEWLLLAYCFMLCRKNCTVCEVITITDAAVLLEKGHHQPEQSYRFQRAWVKLDWLRAPVAGHPSRLAFRLHGKHVEFGRFLVESERVALARELQRILSSDR